MSTLAAVRHDELIDDLRRGKLATAVVITIEAPKQHIAAADAELARLSLAVIIKNGAVA